MTELEKELLELLKKCYPFLSISNRKASGYKEDKDLEYKVWNALKRNGVNPLGGVK